MNELYCYPCEDSSDCLDFLEGTEKGLSFVDFCKKYCANCPERVILDIPYEEQK